MSNARPSVRLRPATLATCLLTTSLALGGCSTMRSGADAVGGAATSTADAIGGAAERSYRYVAGPSQPAPTPGAGTATPSPAMLAATGTSNLPPGTGLNPATTDPARGGFRDFAGDAASGMGAPFVSVYHELGDQFRSPHLAPNDKLPFDGSYSGYAERVSGTGPCPEDRHGVLMVGDNVLTYAFEPGRVFMVPVSADGGLHGVAGDTTLEGRIDRNRLDMVVTGPACSMHMVARFVLNHS